MKRRPPTLLIVFLFALLALAALAWVRAGTDRHAGLEAQARALALTLRAAALDSMRSLEAAEDALAGRLSAAARRADSDLASLRGTPQDALAAAAREERVGRAFLFGPGGALGAPARARAPAAAAPDLGGARERLDRMEAEEAARAMTLLAPSPGEVRVEGLRFNAFETRVRFGVAYGRRGGGSLLLRADADEMAEIARRFGLDPVLERIRAVPGILDARLVARGSAEPGPLRAPPADGPGETGLTAEERVPTPGGGWETVRVTLSTEAADAALLRSRAWILGGALTAAAVAVAAWLVLRARDLRAARERARLEQRKEEDLRLAEAGALASLGAHEISNPLNAIRLGLRLLDGTGPPESAGVIATIRSESERMSASLEAFLSLARGRPAGRDSVDPSLLRGVAESVAADAEARGVRVRTRVAADAPATVGTRDVLEQALTSVVRNAVQASPERGTVDVSWERAEDGGVRIAVADRGPGFPKPDEGRANLLRLGRGGRPGGHGLGLPLAKRFVEAHGGRLVLGDAAGGGALVEVFLPAAPRETVP